MRPKAELQAMNAAFACKIALKRGVSEIVGQGFALSRRALSQGTMDASLRVRRAERTAGRRKANLPQWKG